MQEEEGGSAPEETRFGLPCSPSPGVMLFLLGASRELQRCGTPTSPTSALQTLQWDLGKAVLHSFG